MPSYSIPVASPDIPLSPRHFISGHYFITNTEFMIDLVWIQKVKRAIEIAHGGTAKYLYTVPVHDKRDGATFWYGRVHVFNLQQGEVAKTMYAWFEELDAGPRRFYTVLRDDRIDSPAAAVRLIMKPES